jgi:fibronectin-binding autotransporter adhesin
VDEQTLTSEIRNPANGGTVSPSAHILASGTVIATGPSNAASTITLENGSSLTLDASQVLHLGPSGLLIRPGAFSTTITGGTISFGADGGSLFAGADAALLSTLSSAGDFRKLGPGQLTLSSAPQIAGSLMILDGHTALTSGSLLAATRVAPHGSGVLVLPASASTLGSLSGNGTLELGGATVSIGSLPDDMDFSGNIRGAGHVIIVNGGNPAAIRRFSGSSEFAGGLTLQGGRLASAPGANFGKGTVNIEGGSLWIDQAQTVGNTFNLFQTLVVEGPQHPTFSAPTISTGNAGVLFQTKAGATIEGQLSHAGETRISLPPGVITGGISSTDFTLTISGQQGAITSSPVIRAGPRTRIVLQNSAAVPDAPQGRLPDNAIVHLDGARFEYSGNSTTPSFERFGALRSSGGSTLTITPRAAGSVLEAQTLERENRGVFLIRGTGLGNTPGPSTSTLRLTALPSSALVGGGGTGPLTSIIPFAIGDTTTTGEGSGLLTLDPVNGVRLLSSTQEYLPDFSASTSLTNVRLAEGVILSGPTSANALLLANGFTSITGTGPITITSGVVLKQPGAHGNISVPLDFGENEAIFYVPTIFSSSGSPVVTQLALNAGSTGAGGFTKSGWGDLCIAAPNEISGRVLILQGHLVFGEAAHVGSSTAPIEMIGGLHSTGLKFIGTSAQTVSRDLHITATPVSIQNLSSVATRILTLSGVISGNTGLLLSGNAPIRLSGANTYTGDTSVSTSLSISSDANLGNGGALIVSAGGNLSFDGPWTTSRRVVLPGSNTTFAANGNALTFNSPIEGSGSATFSNSPAVRLRTQSPYTGHISLADSTLIIEDDGAIDSSSISGAGVVEIHNETNPRSGRLSKSPNISVAQLHVLGNATVPVSENIGGTGASSRTDIRLTARGTAGVSLTASSLTDNPSAYIVVSANGLDAPANSAFTRFNFSSAPATSHGIAPQVWIGDYDTGAIVSFGFIDPTVDAAGPVGVRPLRPTEYVSGPIRNPANGGSMPLNANVLAATSLAVAGEINTINTLTFEGVGGIQMTSGQKLHVSAPGFLVRSGANARIDGGTVVMNAPASIMGDGDLVLVTSLDVPALIKVGGGLLQISIPAFEGSLQLNRGQTSIFEGAPTLTPSQLVVRPGATLTVNGSKIIAKSVVSSGHIDLKAGGRLVATHQASIAGSISGSGGVSAITEGPTVFETMAISAPLTYTGATEVGRSKTRGSQIAPDLKVTHSGSISQSSSITVADQSTLSLVYSSAGAPPAPKIGDVPIHLISGILRITNTGTPVVQQHASLAISHASRIHLEPGSDSPIDLHFGTFIRSGPATLNFFEQSTGTISPPRARVFFEEGFASLGIGANTTETSKPIVPFAIHALGSAAGNFVSYDPVQGVRPLAISEYASTLSPGQNVRLSSVLATNELDVTVNSLLLSGAVLQGSGTVRVASGAVANTGLSKSWIYNHLHFGNVEGFIHSEFPLDIHGTLTANAGLNLSLRRDGLHPLILTGNNNLSGPVTIHSGELQFSSPQNLGSGDYEIHLVDGTLHYSGDSLSDPIGKPLHVDGYLGTVSSTRFNTFVITPGIIGAGGLRIKGNVELGGPNFYSGITQNAGALRFASDSVFGASQTIRIEAGHHETSPSGLFRMMGAWTTNRDIDWDNNAIMTLDTGAFDADLRGTLRGMRGTLTKVGAGHAHIHHVDFLELALNVMEGSATFDAANAGTSAVVAPNARMEGTGTLSSLNVRGTLAPGNSPGRLSTGSLTFGAGARLEIELLSSSEFDQVVTTGLVKFDGPVELALQLGFDPLDHADQFTLIDNQTSEAIQRLAGAGFTYQGTLIPEGQLFTAGAQEWLLSYTGGDGNDAVLFAVPEPGSVTSILAAFALLGLRRFRQR